MSYTVLATQKTSCSGWSFGKVIGDLQYVHYNQQKGTMLLCGESGREELV